MALHSIAYRLLVFGLSCYTIYLLIGMYRVDIHSSPKFVQQYGQQFQHYGQQVQQYGQQFQDYIKKTYNEKFVFQNGDFNSHNMLVNSSDPHSYAQFYRKYWELVSGNTRRHKLAEIEKYESDHLLQWSSWFQGSLSGVRSKWKGKGIVLLTSTYDIRRTVLQLKALQFLKVPSEIKVFYTIESSPMREELEMLKRETGFEAEELTMMLPPKMRELVTIKLAKAFAAFYSPYEKVIVADSETVFVADPTTLFDDMDDSGGLFALDRNLFPGNYELAKYVIDILPQPFSRAVANGYFVTQKSSYQQDSTVVVINKSIGWLGLIAVGNLLLPPLDKMFRPKFDGEKEAFWIGFEQAGVPFKFEKVKPVSAGHLAKVSQETLVCGGHILHFFENGSPAWISGGFDRNTGRDSSPQAEFFRNIADPNKAGKWYPNLCQEGESIDFPSKAKPVLEFMAEKYSPDYMQKYFEEKVQQSQLTHA